MNYVSVLLMIVGLVGFVHCHEICIDTSQPKPAEGLQFCGAYANNSCCRTDADIANQFNSIQTNLKGSNPACAALLQSILCAKCDPFSAHLFGVEDSAPRQLPILCSDFCTTFYNTCKDAMLNVTNPFMDAASLAQKFPTRDDFCMMYGGDFDGFCFNGGPVIPPVIITPDQEVCTEKLSNISYLYLAQPNDGTDRIFLNTKDGHIHIYNRTTNEFLGEFLDISHKVTTDSEAGLLSIAFHPKYSSNGLFYIFYSCNNQACPITCRNVSDCNNYGHCTNGICSLKMNASKPIHHINIVAQYKVSASDPNKADLDEVVLIKEYHPFGNHDASSMEFGPLDNYLYITFGDGGAADDSELNAQDLLLFNGKMIRIDVNSKQDGKNYSVPNDNPFVGNSSILPEIWAYGFRNPWRCSFDKQNPTYLFCADVGQNTEEEVDLIYKGANYGWSLFEGSIPFHTAIPQPNITGEVFPIMEYNRSVGGAVIGGYRYTGKKDACQCGKYIFGDFVSGVYFQGLEIPARSGTFQRSNLSVSCSDANSTESNDTLEVREPCTSLGAPQSFGQDLEGEVYFLTLNGLFRTTEAAKCGRFCPCDCMIDGVCLKEGAINSINACQVCRKDTPCKWSQLEGCVVKV